MGETYVDMHAHPEWRDQVQTILPVYPKSGRPLDLFKREYPEIWDLRAERGDAQWHMLGLFHWGLNKDILGDWEPADAPREIQVQLSALGLDMTRPHLFFNAWTHDWKWSDDDDVTEELQPRTTKLLLVREKPAVPSVVFTSRHLMGTAVDVADETWNDETDTVSATLMTVVDDLTTVFVADGDLTLDSTSFGTEPAPADADSTQENGIAKVTFTAVSAQTKLSIKFVTE